MNMMTTVMAPASGPLPLPTNWPTAAAAYLTARDAEDRYHALYVDPHLTGLPMGVALNAAVARLSAEIAAGAELTEVRLQAEEALMPIPSPDATAFALKVRIAFEDGDERRPEWTAIIWVEAARFATVAA